MCVLSARARQVTSFLHEFQLLVQKPLFAGFLINNLHAAYSLYSYHSLFNLPGEVSGSTYSHIQEMPVAAITPGFGLIEGRSCLDRASQIAD